MSNVLSDGSVIPKYFSPHAPVVNAQGDMALRMGRITNIFYPTDPGNISATFVEYDVLTDYTDSSGNYSKVLYPRCKVISRFGGSADFEFYTYRKTTITPDQLNSLDEGSIVLLLCLNGNRREGYIIGGIPTDLLPLNANFTNLALASGTNYVWEFNGAIINVDDAGELSLKYTGKTKNDGTPDSSVTTSNAQSEILFDSQGQLLLSANNDNYVLIGNAGPDGNFINIVSLHGTNVLVNTGDISLDIKSPSNGVKTGAATDNTMLGTTYRTAEGTMNLELVAQLLALSATLTTAGTALTTAGTLMIVPVVGSMIAGPFVDTAASSLLASVDQIQAMVTAISNFEGAAETYLSKRNKSD